MKYLILVLIVLAFIAGTMVAKPKNIGCNPNMQCCLKGGV
jgi:hypothetical protein